MVTCSRIHSSSQSARCVLHHFPVQCVIQVYQYMRKLALCAMVVVRGPHGVRVVVVHCGINERQLEESCRIQKIYTKKCQAFDGGQRGAESGYGKKYIVASTLAYKSRLRR